MCIWNKLDEKFKEEWLIVDVFEIGIGYFELY